MKYYCRFLIVLTSFLFCYELYGQNPPFQLGYNGGADDLFKDISECTDGGFIAVGSTKSFGAGNNDVLLVRTDLNGNLIWAKTIGAAGNDVGNGIAQTSDHGFIIAGTSGSFNNSGNDDVLIIRTDSNGIVLWTKTYGDTLPESAEYILKTSDGNFIAGGNSYDSILYVSQDGLQLKIDENGNLIWARIVGSGAYEAFYASTELPDGSLINAGFTNSGNASAIMERILSDGTSVWRKKFIGAANEYFYDVAYGLNGKIMAVGTTNSFGIGGYDVFMAEVDSTPANQICKTAGTTGAEFANSISATADSGFIISGMTNAYSFNGTYDPFVMKVNAAGLIQWNKVYGSPDDADIISAGIPGSNERYIFAGYSYGLGSGNNSAAFLIKTDTSGDGGCNTNAFAFTQQTNGVMSTFGMYDSLPVVVLIPRILSSSPVSNLQLNPLCPSGIAFSNPETELNIFPNPSNGNFSFLLNSTADQNTEIEICDPDGRIVFTKRNLFNGENEIDISDLPSGIYFLFLKNENKIISRKKIIVTKNG